jgi:hypothetical protein
VIVVRRLKEKLQRRKDQGWLAPVSAAEAAAETPDAAWPTGTPEAASPTGVEGADSEAGALATTPADGSEGSEAGTSGGTAAGPVGSTTAAVVDESGISRLHAERTARAAIAARNRVSRFTWAPWRRFQRDAVRRTLKEYPRGHAGWISSGRHRR